MRKLKEKLNAKLSKNGGFTLVEMLIVVAIIAILIAVSIPLVSNALEKARDATDQANERAAKAETLLIFLSGGKIYNATTGDAGTDVAAATPFGASGNTVTAVYYDAVNGRLTTANPTTGYGKCTADGHYTGLATQGNPNNEKVLKVACSADGIVTLEWTAHG